VKPITGFTNWCQRNENWRYCQPCKQRLDREAKRRRAVVVA
jgi:hypothetical protein